MLSHHPVFPSIARRAAAVAVVLCAFVSSPRLLAQQPPATFPQAGPQAGPPVTAITNPLAPLDTSSPRATLRSFRATIDHVYSRLKHEGIAIRRHPETARLVGLTLSCLDLSKVAISLASTEGRGAAICLKEVLDRIPLPPDAEIPDFAMVQAGSIKRWRIPGTEIVLVRISDGNRDGDFVFSADSVARAEHFYDRISSLPYRPDAGSPGLRELYIEAGGWMIPVALIAALPAWARMSFYDETLWQWAATFLLVAAAASAGVLAWRIARWLTITGRYGTPGRLCFPAALIAISITVDSLLTFQIRLTNDNLLAAKIGLHVITLVGVVAGVLVVMSWVSDLLIRARGMRPEGIDSQLIRLGGKVLTFLLVAWIVIQAADSLGIPVTPLVAGLGAGGLAIALASQYTLENLIAGLVIFADKPVRIGDDCRFGNIRGRVEQIGLRSTRIRGDDRALISVPNAEFAKLQLVNFSQRDHIPLSIPITLSAGASSRQLRGLLKQFEQLLIDHPRLANKPVAARLTAQGPDALSVTVSAVALTADEEDFASIREDVLLAIMEVVAASGCEATATSTIRVAA